MCRGLERSKLGLLETTPPRSTFQTSELFGGDKAYSCSNGFIAYYPKHCASQTHARHGGRIGRRDVYRTQGGGERLEASLASSAVLFLVRPPPPPLGTSRSDDHQVPYRGEKRRVGGGTRENHMSIQPSMVSSQIGTTWS